MTKYTISDGPEGPLLLAVDDDGALVRLHFAHRDLPVGDDWVRDDDALAPVITELDEYFAGTRTAFDLPIRLHGTPFQLEVWEQLRAIPYGETISYGELAKRVDRPEAAARSARRTGRTPSPSWCPATGSSAPTAPSPASVAGSTGSGGFSSTSNPRAPSSLPDPVWAGGCGARPCEHARHGS